MPFSESGTHNILLQKFVFYAFSAFLHLPNLPNRIYGYSDSCYNNIATDTTLTVQFLMTRCNDDAKKEKKRKLLTISELFAFVLIQNIKTFVHNNIIS